MSSFPRLATPADLPRLVTGDDVHRQWPPPGTSVVPVATPEPWVSVQGTPSEGDPGDWWVTDLATVTGLSGAALLAQLLRMGGLMEGPVGVFAATAGHYPVIWEFGARTMRWISSVFRGTIGAVEQFQYGINWGNPGNDPDPNEAEALSMAQTLLDTWKIAASTANPTTLSGFFVPNVVWREVGVTVKTQTEATESDGSGGNLEQKFDTQWAAYTVGSEYKGTNGTNISLPYETSCAVTLQTDTRGASGRGRLFLPPFGTSVMSTDGLYASSIQDTIGQTFGDFFTSIETSTGHKPVVVSRRKIQLHEITSINVGLVPDSQRRRRRSQDEARVTTWTTP